MTFGDGGNDIKMLKYYEYSYAMESVSPDMKDAERYYLSA